MRARIELHVPLLANELRGSLADDRGGQRLQQCSCCSGVGAPARGAMSEARAAGDRSVRNRARN